MFASWLSVFYSEDKADSLIITANALIVDSCASSGL